MVFLPCFFYLGKLISESKFSKEKNVGKSEGSWLGKSKNKKKQNESMESVKEQSIDQVKVEQANKSNNKKAIQKQEKENMKGK